MSDYPQSKQNSPEAALSHNVRDFGAVGDGQTLDTKAIQTAIDQGGTVIVPPGTYLCGTIYLHSGTDLVLMPGAVLKGSPNFDDYNSPDLYPNTVSKNEHANGRHLVMAVDCKDVTIRGGGRIDGALENWFTTWDEGSLDTAFRNWITPPERPSQMVLFCDCQNVRVENVELYNSPYWTLLFWGCQDVYVTRVRIRNSFFGHNGDGIGLDCVKNAIISDCDIAGSDDCITLRACSAKLHQTKDCENIAVSNCLLTTRQAGIRVGLGNGTKIRNAVFSNIVVRKGTYGIVVNASWRQDQGAHISNLMFSNMTICAHIPFTVTNSVAGGGFGQGTVSNVTFSHIRCEGTYATGITGDADRMIRDVVFQDVILDYPDRDLPGTWNNYEKTHTPLVFRHVQNLTLDGVQLRRNPRWAEGVEFRNCQGVLTNLCRWDEPCFLPPMPEKFRVKEEEGLLADYFRGSETE